jgi:DNA-directed RNA polymerase subunit beta'
MVIMEKLCDKGDTLRTLICERFKSSDIIQGLPKVEQLSEAYLNNSMSMNLIESFENWTGGYDKIYWKYLGFIHQ